MRSLPALLLCVLFLSTACRSGPTAIERRLDEDTADEYPGLPEEWAPWLGIDDWTAPTPMDWESHLKAVGLNIGSYIPRDGEAALFEIRFVNGQTVKHWYVLIRPEEDGKILLKRVNLKRNESKRMISAFLICRNTLITVAADGSQQSPARMTTLPSFAPHLGFTVGSADELLAEYKRLDEAGEVTPEIEDQLVTTVCEPGLALSTVFQALQDHRELNAVLRQVVDTPSVLSIIMNGGIDLSLNVDTTASQLVDCPIGSGRTVPGVHFPAQIEINGDPALDLEIYATDAVQPFHLTGGLVGLRATAPGDDSKYVELRLIGARRLRDIHGTE